MDSPRASPPVDATARAAPFAVRDLGRMEYRQAWELQKRLVAERYAGTAPDTLLVVEHEPVITVGRGARDGEGVLAAGALAGGAAGTPIIDVERGGQATWHGPGQIVVYPIVKLADGRHDLHGWMRALEHATICTVGEWGLAAGRREGATGVWIDGQRKLCSIGVAATRWVTWHGLALNHENDLSQFAAINPCGFDAAVMTSMHRELEGGSPRRPCPPRGPVVAALVRHLRETLRPFQAMA